MSDAMNEPVTRAEFAEFREDLDRRFATKAELREEVAKLATRAELHSALEIWAGALRADAQDREERFKADAQQREERMTSQITMITASITATITSHVSTEIARHTGAILERTQTEIGAVDDKYRDVLPRLANVEAQAHTHPLQSTKKATGRRSR